MTPTSTYRMQVRPGFDLDRTAELAGYLADLGVTHLYSSPLLAATPGSQHGYDVVDPTNVNPEIGGPAGLDRLVVALRQQGLGLVVDIVPNHAGVAVPAANPAWWSVLAEGPASPYAAWFDIDWARGPLLIPVLADEAAADDIRIVDGELRYFEHRYPLAAGTGEGPVDVVHARQHYRLVDWRRGDAELTYRRFFAVTELAGLRVEDPAVFRATHAEVLRWIGEGLIDGLRVDHPDGLREPGQYLDRLRKAMGPGWLVVEKILEYGETVPAGWPADGTTGYDALREVCGVFVDPAGAEILRPDRPWAEAMLDGKRRAGSVLLATELTRLVGLEPELAEVPDVRAALVEVAAQLDVYRSYLPEGADHLRHALDRATRRYPAAVARLAPLLLDHDREIALRFQQFTGAVMAKGVEDTAYYRWTRFIALNEVGGAPDRFGLTPAEFHAAAAQRQAQWPAGMTTLSTHDTKRSEDVRARLAVLAEMAPRWSEACTKWMEQYPLAEPDLARLLWQTVLGAWPIERARLQDYAVKAAREAATITRWDEPDAAFEARMHAIVDAMYDDEALRAAISEFAAQICAPGWSNALGQKLVQVTMPGVPDIYQGTELWDNSLVDPDNRRPVDFTLRQSLLRQLETGSPPAIDATGAAKLFVTSRALRLRRDRPELFTGYTPVSARGTHADHVLAFDRGGAATVVTRLPVGLADAGGWSGDDRLDLPSGRWVDELTGEPVTGGMGDLFARYPVALLVRAA